MLRDDLRAFWTELRPPGVPARVWRDWVLVGAGLGGVVVETAVRTDVVWRPVAVAVAAWLCVVTLWRRTHPLAAAAGGFGAIIALQVASLVLAAPEPVGLNSSLVVLALVYAVPRWGSGREIVLSGVLLLAMFVLGVTTDDVPVGDQIGGFIFLCMPAVIGASVRFWAAAREREMERARSVERERIARELHDTVAHHVSAMVIRAQAGRVAAAANPAAAVEALDGVEEEGARTLEEMRAMVAALRHSGSATELAPQAGVGDLRRLLGRSASHLRVDLDLGGELAALSPAVDAAVYRIVQESVTNAMRHAVDATEVVVRVVGEPRQVRVTVTDDGARAGRGRAGYGLTGLRERAALLGGQLEAGPRADRGWQVEAELPRGVTERRAHSRTRR
ncbi:histidine kinase [Actinoplanes sp. NPDC051861]|uniref:sensor histidine kinase n=1 Tax=Actinoplanes sp. NPDC051861 TaxID=3155170 RepID=UPI0034203400